MQFSIWVQTPSIFGDKHSKFGTHKIFPLYLLGTGRVAKSYQSEKFKLYINFSKSYVYCTLGYTATVFVTGGVAFWGPAFAEYQIRMEDPTADTDDVGFYFGLITITGGVLGSAVGTLASKFMRSSRAIGQTSDAIACAIGALFTGPLLYMTMFVARFSTFGMWAMVFWTLTFLSINLVLNQEITLYGKNLKKS